MCFSYDHECKLHCYESLYYDVSICNILFFYIIVLKSMEKWINSIFIIKVTNRLYGDQKRFSGVNKRTRNNVLVEGIL